MTNKVLIASVAVSAVAALLLIPKTRKMIVDAVSGATDSLLKLATSAKDSAVDVKHLARQ